MEANDRRTLEDPLARLVDFTAALPGRKLIGSNHRKAACRVGDVIYSVEIVEPVEPWTVKTYWHGEDDRHLLCYHGERVGEFDLYEDAMCAADALNAEYARRRAVDAQLRAMEEAA